MSMKRFEELLAAFQHECIEYGVRGGMQGVGVVEPVLAARSALIEYVRERMSAECHGTRALVYLAGVLSTSTPCKGSSDWIAEALSATKEVLR